MSFPYEWALKDGYPGKGIESHNCKVFGTFICGGGSTMGYKLAGYDHIGGVEIDPQVAGIYKVNHKPKHLYLEDIRKFNDRTDLPAELYDLDLLDGSPPCSSFSMAGSRDKDWGKEKKFREGQASQRLDDLVYVYIETIKKLMPKVAVLENVKGLIQGNAKSYAKKMQKQFEAAGYRVQVFLLNAASMGVPQKRERVFFVGVRDDLDVPELKLNFNERAHAFGEIRSKLGDQSKKTERQAAILKMFKEGDKSISCVNARIGKPNNGFNAEIVYDTNVVGTIDSKGEKYRAFDRIHFSVMDFILSGTYPTDYNFRGIRPQYLIGMSVPPVMTAQLSSQIYKQWLKPIKEAA